MAEVKVSIGGRDFEVACQDGEEHYLQSAAGLLDNEAAALNDALGRMPETRMLLMAGLMLADKTASLEDQLKAAPSEEGGKDKSARKRAKKAEAALGAAQSKLADAKAKLAEVQSEAEAAAQERDEALQAMTAMVEKLEAAAEGMKKAG